VLSKSRIFKFLKRDCGTIPVAEITSGKIEIFSKHQRFLIATDSSKYLLIFVYMSVLYYVNYYDKNIAAGKNSNYSVDVNSSEISASRY
jgi:hypothetical protein